MDRLSWLPDRDALKNGNVIAGQNYYDVYFNGGEISGLTITGLTSPNDWANAILPNQSGHATKVLKTDGTNTSWGDAANEIPSQGGHSGDVLSTNGSDLLWITLNNELPDQSGHGGEFLSTNGSTLSWSSVAASTPGGSDTQIQFNDSGTFGGAALFDWNKTSQEIILDTVPPPSAPTAALAGAGAGNLSIFSGYKYAITFNDRNGNETLIGTLSAAVNVTDPSTDGQISLTNIPLGTNTRITGRNIYRNIAAGSTSFYVVARLGDNTTTTYTDNTSDADLSLNILSNSYFGTLTASVSSPASIGLNITSTADGGGNLAPISIGSSTGQLGRNAVALGQSNEIPAFDAFAFGSANIVTSRFCMSLGNNNETYGPGESFSLGDSNITVSNGGSLSAGFDNENLGASSFILGGTNFTGIGASCSISGTTVTISGNKTTRFSNGGEVTIYGYFNDLLPYYYTRTISAVAFGGGNTTFTLNSAISPLVTTASIVQHNHAINQNNIVIGNNNFSQGGKSLSIGDSNFVSGANGIAIGDHNTVSGAFSTVIGQTGTVSGSGSTLINLGSSGSTTVSASNVFVVNNGNSGLGVLAPTAILHLKAGTTAASSSPLKFNSGTNMTTAETGAIEYNGANLFFTRTGTTRESVWCGNSGASAPATNAGTPTTRYGGDTKYLGDPNAWASVVIGGTTYKIPLYT